MNTLNIGKLTLSLMVGLALTACGGQKQGDSTAASGNNEIVIGFAAPLTGPQSHYGEEYRNGAQLAIDEANAKKLTINGKPATFKLMAEDDAADREDVDEPARLREEVAFEFVAGGDPIA